ncbi:MAG: isoleucine--tRNA ligase [archaeon]
MQDVVKTEEKILKFWDDNQIYQKAKAKTESGKKFFYLDGPPYTTGAIHIGHAWGKALRDSLIRFKRMNGFNVWDQPGFDMHGLPIEVSVEKELGLKNKKEILEKLGMKKFIEECEKYAISKMHPMIKDFKRLGIWMDWENPYMTVKTEYIEGAWYALSLANKNGYLYQGKKSMTWCPRCATALAKHELEYENVKDDSIFVKLPVIGEDNTFLIVWTTTPWTIPFNMGVMAHPEYDYVKVKIEDTGEIWILAKALAGAVIQMVAGHKYKIVEELKGLDLYKTRYKHPFFDEIPYHQKTFDENEKAYSVVMSEKYVDVLSGSGLVHMAPGCGAEDYEVGKEFGIPAFNLIDEHGVFPEEMGLFKGLVAKKDDPKFIEAIDKKGFLVASTPVVHEYPGCWRCKSLVVFRATNQWFLAVENLKSEMIEHNKKILWVPDWAGNKWFDSWLRNLQDWCISRQRFWGIPLPIWVCECGQHKVLGSKKEVEDASGMKLENLHRPWIDEVKIKCKCGKEMSRIEDILDVWLDSGAAPWATLGYPGKTELYDKLGQPDLILEGKDQIRGWFNSLMALSMVAFKQPSYKAVYMHGFINDSEGRKMSKSLKNIISPYEVIEKYGADTFRYYAIGAANPGVDMNYNFDDLKLKHKNIFILSNLVNFLIDLVKTNNVKPNPIDKTKLEVEEVYILSKLHSTLNDVTNKFNKYQLNEVPLQIEDLFLELSRTYIQLVRDKAATGTPKQKQIVIDVIHEVLLKIITMLATVMPMISEELYLKLKENGLGASEESVHLLDWPKAEASYVSVELEENFEHAKDVIATILSAREKAIISVRWPLSKVTVLTMNKDVLGSLEKLQSIVLRQTNIKQLLFESEVEGARVEITMNPGTIGKDFKADAPQIKQMLNDDVMKKIYKEGSANVDKFELNRTHIHVKETLPANLTAANFKSGVLYIDTELNKELEAEGFARELMRRVQNLRKKVGLEKSDEIELAIQTGYELNKWKDDMMIKVGAKSLVFERKEFEHSSKEMIKGEMFNVSFKILK